MKLKKHLSFFSRAALTLLLMLLTTTAWAEEIDGINYELDDETHTAKVADNTSYSDASVIIPATVEHDSETFDVTSIGDLAFSGCSGLTSITIGSNVTSIGSDAFKDTGWYNNQSDGLLYLGNWLLGYKGDKPTTLTIDGNTKGIADAAFSDCSDLTSVTIPNSVTSIGDWAFYGCSSLTSITIPNSVTSIGESAFFNCSGLKSITIPNSVTSIGEYAFSYTGLTSVSFADGSQLTTIAGGAFSYCSSLTSITIPDGVTSIGEYAFKGCSGLTAITIPSSVTNIGYYAFTYCSGLNKITVDAGNTVYDSRDNCNAIISTATNKLIFGCKSTTIPASVTSISYGAFLGCSGLTSITIPEGVTSIGSNAFKDTGWYNNQSDGLLYLGNWLLGYKGDKPTALTINDGTRGIVDNAFEYCSDLTSVSFPASVTSIGQDAFNSTGLTSVSFADGSQLTTIARGAFSRCSGLTVITIPNSVTSIGKNAFSKTGLTSISFADGSQLTTIGEGAFSSCSGLTSITIPNSVTNIGNDAFSYTGLTSVSFADGSQLTAIAEGAFYSCSGLTAITIPNSVTSIGKNAFSSCSGLTSITIPNSVTNIGNDAFSYTGLTSVSFADGSQLTAIAEGAFFSCSGLTSITIPASVTTIAGGAFSRCSGLTSITIPNSVTTISDNAFHSCSGLKTVIIGNGVTTIGDGAFASCNHVDDVYCYANPSTLTWDKNEWDFKSGTPKTQCHVSDASAWSGFTKVRVDFVGDLSTLTSGDCGTTGSESSVTWAYDLFSKTLTISGTGQMMYYGSAMGSDSQYHSTAPWSRFDNDIQTVTVGSGVTYIGSYAFAYCGALTSISLPESVIQMGDYVCYSSNIARIEIPCATGAVTLGTGGFDACPAGLQIAVPSTLLGTYQGATNWSTYATKLVGVLSETDGFGTGFATGNYELKRTFKCGAASTVCLPFSVPAAQASSIGKFYTFAGIDKTGADWVVVMEEATNGVTTDLAANTPYLFVPYIFTGKSQGDEVDLTISGTVSPVGNAGYSSWTENSTTGSYWTFQGVFYNLSWPVGDADLGKIYGFAAQSYAANGVSPGDFVKAAAGASIKPFRAFLQFTPGTSSARNVTRAAAESLPATMTVRLVSSNGISTAIGTLDTRTGEISLDDAWFSLDGHRLSGKPSKKGLYIWNGKKVVIK